jgi:hypothetical protein
MIADRTKQKKEMGPEEFVNYMIYLLESAYSMDGHSITKLERKNIKKSIRSVIRGELIRFLDKRDHDVNLSAKPNIEAVDEFLNQ